MIRLHSRGVCTTALAVLFAALAVAPAQYVRNPPRSVSGSVTDGSNEPIRGAVVQVEATDTLVIQSYVTDERGTYHFRELRPDVDYSLWAMFRGNRSKTYTLGKFDKQLDRVIPIKIELISRFGQGLSYLRCRRAERSLLLSVRL